MGVEDVCFSRVLTTISTQSCKKQSALSETIQSGPQWSAVEKSACGRERVDEIGFGDLVCCVKVDSDQLSLKSGSSANLVTARVLASTEFSRSDGRRVSQQRSCRCQML